MKNRCVKIVVFAVTTFLFLSCDFHREIHPNVVYNAIEYYPGGGAEVAMTESCNLVRLHFYDNKSKICTTKLFVDDQLLKEYCESEWVDTISLSKYTKGSHSLMLLTEYTRFSDRYNQKITRYGMAKIIVCNDEGTCAIDTVEMDKSFYRVYYVSDKGSGISVDGPMSGIDEFIKHDDGSISAYKHSSEIRMNIESGWYVVTKCDGSILDTTFFVPDHGNPVVCNVDELPTGKHSVEMEYHLGGSRSVVLPAFSVMLDSLYWDWKKVRQ